MLPLGISYTYETMYQYDYEVHIEKRPRVIGFSKNTQNGILPMMGEHTKSVLYYPASVRHHSRAMS